MDNETLRRKYELANSDIYKQIRSEIVNYIIKMSNSSLSPEIVKGMLLVLKEVDGWIDAFNIELAKRKD